MKPGYILYFLGLITLFSSCLKDDFDSNDLVIENDINYLHPSLDLGDFPNDPFRIIGITTADDFFNIIVEYTGGCEEHRFFTWWDGDWTASNPAKSTFYLSHGNRGDNCERVVRDTVQLDLNKVFNGTYPQQKPFINVKNAYNKKTVAIDPYLSELGEKENCQIKASIGTMTCVEGIWLKVGLLLSDSVQNHEKIWIQPVKNSDGISLDIPASGDYSIQITPIFGFEFDKIDDQDCQEQPDETLLPAAINCMRKL